MIGSVGARHVDVSTPARIRSLLVPLLFFFVALLSRWKALGDPIITGVDEQFYALVASRMLHGATLYVDLWDRKPIGLFLIYAAGRLFGNVFLGSQILALLSVTGTAVLVYRMALRIADQGSSVLAGLIYIVFLTLAGGEGGQSPVFYNLLVTGAIAVVLRARNRAGNTSADLRWGGAIAMWRYPVQGRDYVIHSRVDSPPSKLTMTGVSKHQAKSCRAQAAPPWSDPVHAFAWHLAPLMGACI